MRHIALAAFGFLLAGAVHADTLDQITIKSFDQVTWRPLHLDGFPDGMQIATLHGDLTKGGADVLLQTPAGYMIPNHSHSSPEVYLLLHGAFTYIADDGTSQAMDPPVYISLPPNTPHALQCGKDSACVLYVHYVQPFDVHVHPMPTKEISAH